MKAKAVRYCPYCGIELVNQIEGNQQLPTCPACGWVKFSDPKVAVAALVIHKREVLLVQRSNEPFRGLWSLPAGFLNAGEDPAKAAERECFEETNLRVKSLDLVEVKIGREHPHSADLLLIYQCEIMSGQLQAGDDADKAAFFPIDVMPPLAFQNIRSTMAQFIS